MLVRQESATVGFAVHLVISQAQWMSLMSHIIYGIATGNFYLR